MSFGVNAGAQQTFTPQQCQAFAEIYMFQKSDSRMKSVSIDTYLKKHKITPQRYRNLMLARAEGKNITLTSNEKALLADVQDRNKEIAMEVENSIKAKCEIYGIEFDDYLSILHKYKSNIEFQRSLKPYFDKVIEKM